MFPTSKIIKEVEQRMASACDPFPGLVDFSIPSLLDAYRKKVQDEAIIEHAIVSLEDMFKGVFHVPDKNMPSIILHGKEAMDCLSAKSRALEDAIREHA